MWFRIDLIKSNIIASSCWTIGQSDLDSSARCVLTSLTNPLLVCLEKCIWIVAWELFSHDSPCNFLHFFPACGSDHEDLSRKDYL